MFSVEVHLSKNDHIAAVHFPAEPLTGNFSIVRIESVNGRAVLYFSDVPVDAAIALDHLIEALKEVQREYQTRMLRQGVLDTLRRQQEEKAKAANA